MKWAGLSTFDGYRVNETLAKTYLSKLVLDFVDGEKGSIPRRFEKILRRIPSTKIIEVN